MEVEIVFYKGDFIGVIGTEQLQNVVQAIDII